MESNLRAVDDNTWAGEGYNPGKYGVRTEGKGIVVPVKEVIYNTQDGVAFRRQLLALV